jgi:hypothetical protein
VPPSDGFLNQSHFYRSALAEVITSARLSKALIHGDRTNDIESSYVELKAERGKFMAKKEGADIFLLSGVTESLVPPDFLFLQPSVVPRNTPNFPGSILAPGKGPTVPRNTRTVPGNIALR